MKISCHDRENGVIKLYQDKHLENFQKFIYAHQNIIHCIFLVTHCNNTYLWMSPDKLLIYFSHLILQANLSNRLYHCPLCHRSSWHSLSQPWKDREGLNESEILRNIHLTYSRLLLNTAVSKTEFILKRILWNWFWNWTTAGATVKKKKQKKRMKIWSWEMIKIGFKEHIIYNLFCFYWFILVSLSSFFNNKMKW